MASINIGLDAMNYLSKAYGCAVGTVSKIVYPISYFIVVAETVLWNAIPINIVVSVPIKWWHDYQYPYARGWVNKVKLLCNFNTEFDNLKQISLSLAIGSTIFSSEVRKKMHQEGVTHAKYIESCLESNLCFSEMLCSGDQYGLFDLMADFLGLSGETNNQDQSYLFNYD